MLRTDITIKEENIKGEYLASYQKREAPSFVRYGRSHHYNDIHYTRNVQEKAGAEFELISSILIIFVALQIFQKPPRPMLHDVSEMKEMYQQKHPTHGERLIDAPAEYARCDVSNVFLLFSNVKLSFPHILLSLIFVVVVNI